MEACGTSGMKALANASINVSIMDGWWDEGYAPAYGWAIGHGETYADAEAQDRIESQEILTLLEEEIVPLFYQRGHDRLPREWTEKMKAGLRHLVPIFNSHRMVQEYVNQYYVPCSKRFNALKQGDFSGVRELAAWRRKLMTGWQGVQVEQVIAGDGLELNVGQEVLAQAKVRLGSLTPDDVTVEAYFGRLQPGGDFAERETMPLKVADVKDGLYLYQGSIPTSMTGRFGYTVRITPSREKLENPFIIDLVTWA
jgi:starch phosphorylase